MQVAGRICETCSKSVGVYLDALGCVRCEQVWHAACAGADLRCPVCREALKPGAVLRAQPPASVPVGKGYPRESLAAPGERFMARVVDWLVGVGFAITAGTLATLYEPSIPYSASAGLLAFAIYYFFADGLSSRQSLGKRLFDISVVDAVTSNPCSLRASVLRSVTLLLGPVDSISILGDKRQRWGDQLAGTVVLRRSK